MPTHVFFKALICLLFFFSSGGANADSLDDKLKNKPIANLSTPENALKSYWELKDWISSLGENEFQKFNNIILEAHNKDLSSITSGDTNLYYQSFVFSSKRVVERTINSMTFEVPNQAIAKVTIRDVSPIPKGAEPTLEQIKIRANGLDYKYVITSDSKGDWKVSEVWESAYIPYMLPRKIYRELKPVYPAYIFYD